MILSRGLFAKRRKVDWGRLLWPLACVSYARRTESMTSRSLPSSSAFTCSAVRTSRLSDTVVSLTTDFAHWPQVLATNLQPVLLEPRVAEDGGGVVLSAVRANADRPFDIVVYL
jgi:hypothetical protein